MSVWDTTKYSKWYKSHRRFSFTANHCIELYEDIQWIPDSVFKPFIRSLYCHSKSEEKMFMDMSIQEKILDDHSRILPSKIYSNEEKYAFCKSVLIHMKEEENAIYATLHT